MVPMHADEADESSMFTRSTVTLRKPVPMDNPSGHTCYVNACLQLLLTLSVCTSAVCTLSTCHAEALPHPVSLEVPDVVSKVLADFRDKELKSEATGSDDPSRLCLDGLFGVIDATMSTLREKQDACPDSQWKFKCEQEQQDAVELLRCLHGHASVFAVGSGGWREDCYLDVGACCICGTAFPGTGPITSEVVPIPYMSVPSGEPGQGAADFLALLRERMSSTEIAPEDIHGHVECSRCGHSTPRSQLYSKSCISAFQHTLCVELCREGDNAFATTGQRIQTPCNFPSAFNTKDDLGMVNMKPTTYHLVAVVARVGAEQIQGTTLPTLGGEAIHGICVMTNASHQWQSVTCWKPRCLKQP